MNRADANGALPQGWALTTMGHVAQVVGGGTPKTKTAGNFSDDTGHPWLTPADLTKYQDKYVRHGRRFLTDQGLAGSAAKYMPAGTILFSSRAPIGYVAVAGGAITTNQGFRSFVPSAALDSTYAYHYLKSIRGLAEQLASGTTFSELSGSKAKTLPLLLPPIAEQRRIAERLDEIDALRRSIAGYLRSAAATVDRLRSAVLAAAGSGRLTKDWRDASGIPEWQTASARDVCAKVQSGTTPKLWHECAGGIPFLKVYNVVDQQLDFASRPQYIAPNLHQGAMRRATALPGDVVMNIVGPPLGKVAIITDENPEWSINQALTLFRPSGLVTTEWLYVFLCSGISVSEVIDKTRGTVGQINISLTQCREFQIPVPSLDEQAEVVRRARAMLATTDRLVTKINSAVGSVDRGAKAAVASAFRGELVPTEAVLAEEAGREFESASELLARVESANTAPPQRRRRVAS